MYNNNKNNNKDGNVLWGMYLQLLVIVGPCAGVD
jgi:hypothetical protein